jgi:hypothetical protein
MAAGAAVVAAAIADAIKASGVLVRVAPDEFQKILTKIERPLVVYAEGTFFSAKYKYLTSYKGLAFYTKSAAPLQLPFETEVIRSKKISIPS